MLITGIASNILKFSKDSGTPQLLITLPNGENKSIELESFPDDWGNKDKNDLDFSEIKNELEKHNLIQDGSLSKGVKITRQYTRVTTGYFADLLHPKNQSFIKEIMLKN